MAYATVPDLEAWLAPEPVPDSAVRLLEQASTAIDRALYGAYYDRTDPEIVAVLTQACVRQVHWLIESGDETGAQSDVQSMSTGKRSFSKFARGAGSSATPRLAPGALDVLRVSGLFVFDPLVVG
ncbi:hypothetical protein ACN6LF_001860 [[Kitasatospora] papulosa]|uniref:hypothetical protein n=1 Tax=[Kitasatospora] papulosa TaxID=1464011 RepID=UPI0038653C7A|nr:hypothetical protein OG337_29055 [[Kitasatospora] papulosa]